MQMFLHIDIDSFFCSAERIKNPKLYGIPIAVSGRSDLKIFNKKTGEIRLIDINSGSFVAPVFSSTKLTNKTNLKKGVVITSSYEARACGVKTGMKIIDALNLCPKLKILKSDHPFYHELSHQLLELLKIKTPKVEQFSIDEFFCDISGMFEEYSFESLKKFANYLRNEVYKRLKLPVSIGISSSKWIAKLATKEAKPDGVKIILKHEIHDFIKDKSISRFPGIGKKYTLKLQKYGIYTLGDAIKSKHIFDSLKKPGKELYLRISGEDSEGIKEIGRRKSIGISRTFTPILNREEIVRRISILSRHIFFITQKHSLTPTSFSLKIKYEYGTRSKSKTTEVRFFNENVIRENIKNLFFSLDIYQKYKILHIAISVSDFIEYKPKIPSLMDFDKDLKNAKLNELSFKIRTKYGLDSLRFANELQNFQSREDKK